MDDTIYLQSDEASEFKVSIYNILGQNIIAETKLFCNSALNVETLQTGIYLLKVTTDRGNSQTIKFIKN